MKKSLIALAVLAASGAAMAQSSVTVYGVADAFVGSKNVSSVAIVGGVPVASDQRQTVIDTSGLSGSRWGLKGVEDLGNGLKANFVLESGFNIDSGTSAQGGVLFGRQAFVGLSSNSFGSLSLGRHYSAYDDVKGSFFSAQGNSFSFDATGGTQAGFADIAAYNATGVFTPATLAALNSQVARTGAWVGYQTRINNSIRYETPNFSGFKASVVYGLGENKTAVSGATKNVSASLTYANGPIAAALGYANDELAPGFHVKNTGIGGNYDFGVAKAFAAYNVAKIDGAERQREWSVGVKAPIGATTLIAQYAQSKGDDFGKNKSFGLEAQYSLSKRTTAYAAFNQTKVVNDFAKNNIFGLGVRHTF